MPSRRRKPPVCSHSGGSSGGGRRGRQGLSGGRHFWGHIGQVANRVMLLSLTAEIDSRGDFPEEAQAQELDCDEDE